MKKQQDANKAAQDALGKEKAKAEAARLAEEKAKLDAEKIALEKKKLETDAARLALEARVAAGNDSNQQPYSNAGLTPKQKDYEKQMNAILAT